MELRVAEARALPKRDRRSLTGPYHRILGSNLLESIAEGNKESVVGRIDENGVKTIKLLVRKQDLKQILEMMRGGKIYTHQASPPTLFVDQRLNLLRRRNPSRANVACRGYWTPALQSIPEEL